MEIETLRAQAEVEPLRAAGRGARRSCTPPAPDVLEAYLRNVRLALYDKAQQIYLEARK